VNENNLDADGHIQTRTEDPPDGRERIAQARREGRIRTIFYSALVSGLVALAVVRVGEVQNFNEQVARNRVNCGLLQDDRIDRAVQLEETSDQILGNPKNDIPPADFSKPPYSSFKNLKKLIVANAVQDRHRAQEIRGRIENCNRVFPERHALPIVG
jgi:hypothetical protein